MVEKPQSGYDVATFGIPDFELEVLRRIFIVSADRPNSYRLQPIGAKPAMAHIMMLDRKNPKGVERWADAQVAMSGPTPTVILTQDDPAAGAFHLRRPLLATRVLAVLDAAVEAAKSQENSATPVSTTPVSVPAKSPDTQPAAPATPRAASLPDDGAFATPSPTAPRTPFRALVVDDSRPVRQQIGMALEKVGIIADYAESGEQALDEMDKHQYDIVFLDVIMPGIGGYDACKVIKRDPKRKHIPVIMLTGNSGRLDKVKGKLSGCDAYMTKPVERDIFYQTLRKYLNEQSVFQ